MKAGKKKIIPAVLIILLIASVVCNILLLIKVRAVDDDKILIENEELKWECDWQKQQRQEAEDASDSLRNYSHILEIKRCNDESYRLARDCKNEFIMCAENVKGNDEKEIYSALTKVKELAYLHTCFESMLYKTDRYFMSESRVNGFGGYMDDTVYFRIYYFYDPSAAEEELKYANYYKDMGDSVYYAVRNLGYWDFDPGDRAETLDSIDLYFIKKE